MKSAGDEIFTYAALASDQHRRVGVGNAVDDGADFPHPGVAAEQGNVTDRVTRIVLCHRQPY